MSNELTLFGTPSSSAMAMLEGYEDDLTSKIAGGAGNNRRLSLKGGVFREIVNGKEVRSNDNRAMNVVLINAAKIARTYYGSTYVEGESSAPVCWSSDTVVPDPSVPEDQRQCDTCMNCPQHIKGSGQGDTRACKFSQRVAVMLEAELDRKEVYQLQLPSTSVFGDGTKDKMPLQAYGRYLQAHNTKAISIVTELRFDTDVANPKLTFKAVRPLTEQELAICLIMRDHPDTQHAITMTVSQKKKEDQHAQPEGQRSPAVESTTKRVAAIPAGIKAGSKPKKDVSASVGKTEEKQDSQRIAEPVVLNKPSNKAVNGAAPVSLENILDTWDD